MHRAFQRFVCSGDAPCMLYAVMSEITSSGLAQRQARARTHARAHARAGAHTPGDEIPQEAREPGTSGAMRNSYSWLVSSIKGSGGRRSEDGEENVLPDTGSRLRGVRGRHTGLAVSGAHRVSAARMCGLLLFASRVFPFRENIPIRKRTMRKKRGRTEARGEGQRCPGPQTSTRTGQGIRRRIMGCWL